MEVDPSTDLMEFVSWFMYRMFLFARSAAMLEKSKAAELDE